MKDLAPTIMADKIEDQMAKKRSQEKKTSSQGKHSDGT